MRTLVSVVMAMAIWLGVVSAEAQPTGVGAEAPLTDYFVAVDNLETFTTGTFAGLPNPNFGRLTLLVAHRSPDDPSGNHFHAIGAVSYVSLEGGGQQVVETSTNNRIPEIFTGQLPLQLLPRSLVEERVKGRASLVSHPTDTEYSHLKIESIQVLHAFPADSPEGLLFNSSDRRWTTPLDGAIVALQRISVTPGLHIANEEGKEILSVGIYELGEGNTFSFFPTYSTRRSAEVGTYSATFKLVDARSTGTPLQESGRFTFDFRIARPGDIDGDSDVDDRDVALLTEALGTPSKGLDDPRDLNHDGQINHQDLQLLPFL
jgi:Dockerin type I domain